MFLKGDEQWARPLGEAVGARIVQVKHGLPNGSQAGLQPVVQPTESCAGLDLALAARRALFRLDTGCLDGLGPKFGVFCDERGEVGGCQVAQFHTCTVCTRFGFR